MTISKRSILVFISILFCLLIQCRPGPDEDEEENNAPPAWCNFNGSCSLDSGLVDSLLILEVEGQSVVPHSSQYYQIMLSNDLKFRVEGMSKGIADQPAEAFVYLLIYPKSPQGAGWYIEKTPAQVEENTGNWFVIGQLGSKVNFHPQPGDTFFIKVFLTEECEKMAGWKILTPSHTQRELACGFQSSPVVQLEVK